MYTIAVYYLMNLSVEKLNPYALTFSSRLVVIIIIMMDGFLNGQLPACACFFHLAVQSQRK